MSKKQKRDSHEQTSTTELRSGQRLQRWPSGRMWGTLGLLIVGGAFSLVLQSREVESAAPSNLALVSSIHYQSQNHIHGLGYDSQNKQLFVATHYGLFVWKDGQLFQLGDNRDDFMGFSLVPTNPKTIYTSGHPRGGGNMGVMRSEDGGLTFKNIFSGVKGETVDFHSMVVSSVNPKILYGWFHGNFYRSKDGGKNWQIPAVRGLPSQGLCWGGPCFAPDSRVERIVYSGTPNGLLVSRDYGDNWAQLQNDLGAVAAVGVHLNDPQTLWVFAQRVGLAVSRDAGKSWSSVGQGLKLSAKEFVFTFAFDGSNPDHLFAATGEQIVRSLDGGKSWQKIV